MGLIFTVSQFQRDLSIGLVLVIIWVPQSTMIFHEFLDIPDSEPIRTMLLKFNRNLSHFIYSLRSRDFILVANVPDCHQAYCIFLGCLCHTLCAFGFCIVVMKFLWDAETCCFLGIIKRLLMGGGEGKPLQS